MEADEVKYRLETVREGENLGPIDWTFDFEGFAKKHNLHEGFVKEATDRLRNLKVGDEVTTDGGWPRVGWGQVVAIAMYDGWPFWYPVPSVMKMGPLGGEWHPWYSITGVISGPTS